MVNKKAIAAFAVGATLLSGLAIAAPALATDPNNNSNTTQNSDTVTEFKNVVFNFKVGNENHRLML